MPIDNIHPIRKSNPYPSHLQTYEADGYDGMRNCVDVQTWNRIRGRVEKQICFDLEGTQKTAASSNSRADDRDILYARRNGVRISGVPYSVEGEVKKPFTEG